MSADLRALEEEEFDRKTKHQALVKLQIEKIMVLLGTLAVEVEKMKSDLFEAKRGLLADPFVKVQGLITCLINRLHVELGTLGCEDELKISTMAQERISECKVKQFIDAPQNLDETTAVVKLIPQDQVRKRQQHQKHNNEQQTTRQVTQEQWREREGEEREKVRKGETGKKEKGRAVQEGVKQKGGQVETEQGREEREKGRKGQRGIGQVGRPEERGAEEAESVEKDVTG